MGCGVTFLVKKLFAPSAFGAFSSFTSYTLALLVFTLPQ